MLVFNSEGSTYGFQTFDEVGIVEDTIGFLEAKIGCEHESLDGYAVKVLRLNPAGDLLYGTLVFAELT